MDWRRRGEEERRRERRKGRREFRGEEGRRRVTQAGSIMNGIFMMREFPKLCP